MSQTQGWNNAAEWKKSDQKKSIHSMIPLWNSRKCREGTNEKGKRIKEGGRDHTGAQETCSDSGYGQYADCTKCFIGIYVCQNSSNCTL